MSFGAGKNHCSFYVQSPAVMDAHRDDLAGYDTARATIRFAPDEPLPAGLVTKLVRARIAETDAAAGSWGCAKPLAVRGVNGDAARSTIRPLSSAWSRRRTGARVQR